MICNDQFFVTQTTFLACHTTHLDTEKWINFLPFTTTLLFIQTRKKNYGLDSYSLCIQVYTSIRTCSNRKNGSILSRDITWPEFIFFSFACCCCCRLSNIKFSTFYCHKVLRSNKYISKYVYYKCMNMLGGMDRFVINVFICSRSSIFFSNRKLYICHIEISIKILCKPASNKVRYTDISNWLTFQLMYMVVCVFV